MLCVIGQNFKAGVTTLAEKENFVIFRPGAYFPAYFWVVRDYCGQYFFHSPVLTVNAAVVIWRNVIFGAISPHQC